MVRNRISYAVKHPGQRDRDENENGDIISFRFISFVTWVCRVPTYLPTYLYMSQRGRERERERVDR